MYRLIKEFSFLRDFKKMILENQRTKNVSKHIGMSFIYKAFTIVSNLLIVPVSISYLNSENYGVWLTLSSFLIWFSFFDIGLGHGLRNKLTEALSKREFIKARGYVSTAYFSILCISIIIFFFLTLASFYLDWNIIFNTLSIEKEKFNYIMFIVFFCFSSRLVLKLIVSIHTANQNHSIQNKLDFLNSISSLIIIYLYSILNNGSLIFYASISSIIPIVSLSTLTYFSFNKKFLFLKPSYSLFKSKYLKDIFGLGFYFFIIQIAGVILFSTDNIIISQIFDPSEVVPYNISFKYFNISIILLTIVLNPYWSSITDAYSKNDFTWIKNSMNRLMKFSLFIICLIVLMYFISDDIYKFWVGKNIIIKNRLSFYMALLSIVTVIYNPFTYFVNGVGKVKLQMFSISITAIINIPLSIYLSKTLNLGVEGVALATILCMLPHMILCPIQYYKIINNRANGLWNK